MNGRRLSDAQIARALREHVATEAPAGLYARIVTEIESTEQQFSLRTMFDGANTAAQRRMLLVLAALLLALMLGAVGLVGALLNERIDRTPDLSLDPPADVALFVRSAYEAMPDLEPVTLTTVQDGSIKGRIYVDESGAIRIEHFAAPDATEPETYKIYAGTRMGHYTTINSRPAWYEQAGAISEDPRVFVYATLGAANFGAGYEPGCETAISPGEVHPVPPASAWEYVGIDYVAGRPTHHFRCVGELWLDVETRLTMRSRGAVLDENGRPLSDTARTIEVTEIEFGQPPPELFEIQRPAGVESMSASDYDCAMNPHCSASPRPLVSPEPAQDRDAPPDFESMIASANSATESLPAFEATLERSNTKYPGSSLRVLYDGSGRFRIEETVQAGTVWESTTISLAGEDYRYVSEAQADGSTVWRNASSRSESPVYPLWLPSSCAGGWQHLGVDLIADRHADHVSCTGSDAEPEFWIDRETHLILRSQSIGDETMGTDVLEVTEFHFVDHPDSLFKLPEGAVPED